MLLKISLHCLDPSFAYLAHPCLPAEGTTSFSRHQPRCIHVQSPPPCPWLLRLASQEYTVRDYFVHHHRLHCVFKELRALISSGIFHSISAVLQDARGARTYENRALRPGAPSPHSTLAMRLPSAGSNAKHYPSQSYTRPISPATYLTVSLQDDAGRHEVIGHRFPWNVHGLSRRRLHRSLRCRLRSYEVTWTWTSSHTSDRSAVITFIVAEGSYSCGAGGEQEDPVE